MDDNAEMLYILKQRSDGKKKRDETKDSEKARRKKNYENSKDDKKKWEQEKETNKKAAKKYREKVTANESKEEKEERLRKVKERMKAYRERKKNAKKLLFFMFLVIYVNVSVFICFANLFLVSFQRAALECPLKRGKQEVSMLTSFPLVTCLLLNFPHIVMC